MILNRDDYCIPFKEVLSAHSQGWDLKMVYEIILLDEKSFKIKRAQLGRMKNRNMALSYARAYFHKQYIVLDAFAICKLQNTEKDDFDAGREFYTWPDLSYNETNG